MQTRLGLPAAVILSTLLASGAAIAGSGNTLYLLQDNVEGDVFGNSLQVDQSDANGSRVGTSLAQPAMQKGSNNDAVITVTGDGAVVYLLQDNSAAGAPTVGNTAIIEAATAGAEATVSQTGDGNDANLFVGGLGEGALITQLGDHNLATVNVNGSHAIGKIMQNGDHNTASLNVVGGEVTYTQNGSSLADYNATDPVSVWSNTGGTILITQTSGGVTVTP